MKRESRVFRYEAVLSSGQVALILGSWVKSATKTAVLEVNWEVGTILCGFVEYSWIGEYLDLLA